MKKHLLSLVLIVAVLFAFIPKTFAQEITDAVVDGNVDEIALDGTNNINEENDGSSNSELEEKEEEKSDDESDGKEETIDQDSKSEDDGEEEKSSEPESSEPEQENVQEEENKKLEEGNSNEEKVEDVKSEDNEEESNDEQPTDDNYKVIFTRDDYKLEIPGGSSILLSQLNSKLGIDISLSDVSEIEISNDEVLRIVKVENSNDFSIQSIKSFSTEETLRILTKDGIEYLIKVVDPVGDPPEHGKELIDNNDGTYTIALTVVGDSEKQVNKVNVVIVLDTSGSMEDPTGNTVVTYTATRSDSASPTKYGLVNGEYVQLERRTSGWWPFQTVSFYYNNVEYTGQRYHRQSANQDRLEAAQEAVNELANALLSNNGVNGNPADTVELALVTFATNSNVRITKTTNYNTFSSTVNGLTANGGTNWEAALNSANGINFGDNDQVYVIFVSDGNPTFRTSQNGFNDRYQNGIYGTGAEEEPNITRAYNAALDDAQAIVNNNKEFYTIGAYGNVDRMESLTTGAGAPARNYYSAEDTAALQEALASILQKIEMAGIGAVSINDGTTSSVTTSSGVSHLLDVDTTSFKYYKDNVEWEDAPEATLNSNGEVVWDLNEVGVLENEVEYKVTFVVWPSQVTLDLIADLKNDSSKYDTLDANIKKYLVKNEDGTYTLLTNTTASLSFKDTREENPQTHTETYDNPEPVSTSATQMLSITKEWSNEIDKREKTAIKIDVLRDGVSWNTLTLNEGNNYQVSTNIAVGIMTVEGTSVEVKASGHDFSFGELGEEAYNWELKSEIVRPMLINGELTILIKKGTEEPTEGTYYKIDGYYYVVGDLKNGVAELTATNERRSWIDLTKTVNYDDNAAQFDDQIFTFEITVNDISGRDIWFSVMDKATNTLVKAADGLVVENANEEAGNTGYYYATSGSAFKVGIKAGWNLRIINLPSGSTYTIEETDLDSKFEFVKVNYNDTTYVDEDGQTVDYVPTISDKTVSGEIKQTNTKYGYEYVNKNVNTEIVVTKVWEDNDDVNKNRPDEVTLKLSNGTDIIAQPDKVDNGDGTWTYTYTNLPVYDTNGDLITYTLEENQVVGYLEGVIEGDTKEGFTITNTLETIDITVEKIWDDNNNQDGIRPTSVTITLSDGTEITLDDSNDWTYTVEGLPKYKNGTEVDYTATEEVPEGYKASYSDDTFTITNTHNPKKADVVVTKVWVDESNKEGLRPEEITIYLYANGEEVDATPEIVKNNDNTWTFTYKDLDVYANGEEIEYTVDEEKEKNYDKSIDGLTITNSRTIDYVPITIKKVWEDDGNRDGIRPKKQIISIMATLEGIDITDIEEQVITLNEDNNWTFTLNNLLKYYNGSEITYVAVEKDVPKGYEASYSEDTFTITNTHVPEKINITVTKVWEDGDNIVEARPESVTVFLLLNGDKVETVELSEDNDWTHTFEDLYVNDLDSKKIEYTVDEQDVDKYDKSISGDSEEGFTITNTYNGEKGDLYPPITGIEETTGNTSLIVELIMSLLLLVVTVTAKKKLFN